jgi:hypothetical protein
MGYGSVFPFPQAGIESQPFHVRERKRDKNHPVHDLDSFHVADDLHEIVSTGLQNG